MTDNDLYEMSKNLEELSSKMEGTDMKGAALRTPRPPKSRQARQCTLTALPPETLPASFSSHMTTKAGHSPNPPIKSANHIDSTMVTAIAGNSKVSYQLISMTWGPTLNFGGFKMLTWRGMTSSRAAIYGTTPPQIPAQDFLLFSFLPAELRLKIWNFAIDDIPKQVFSIQPKQSSIPSVLQACLESRYGAQQTYTKRISHLALNNSLGLRATATMHYHSLRPAQPVAISFQQRAHLTSFWVSQRELDLWNLIQCYAPELKTLYIVFGSRVKGKRVDFVEISGEEAYMGFCDREEKRQLIEAGKGFELAQMNGLWKELRLKMVRKRGEGEEVVKPIFRVKAWGATEWQF
ncbi:hypothetical protein BDZ45DRAFT_747237 [Acephala macrosclerotiorum]|nr:hypothetical protein BDZ45DRAFT_747237 [Acephala macrosclerotiorum]